MGGQACILFGGAEFSRDIDFSVLASVENLERLSAALRELQAEVIAVPPWNADYLRRGHAIHFRCRHPEAFELRVDVMSVLRGVESFDILWERRTSFQITPDLTVDLLSLPDLIKAKKTQRDKDWPMIRRLVEADYARCQSQPSEEQIRFWLRECRTPSILLELAVRHPKPLKEALQERPLLSLARESDMSALEQSLLAEEWEQRQADQKYWQPLRRELESIRHPGN
jgi:hypothetical protein